MNVAICAGRACEREEFSGILYSYFSERGLIVNIRCFVDTKSMLNDITDGMAYDIVFVSVDGCCDTREVYRLNGECGNAEIILISSDTRYAAIGYEIGAAGYIHKPCIRDDFYKVLNRVLRDVDNNVFLIKQRRNIARIPFGDIVYIESHNTKCIVHTCDDEYYNVYRKLSDIEVELSDKRFLRCHRSYLVNMSYISEVGNEFRLRNGEVVLIRRKSLKEMKSVFLAYNNA